MRRALTITLCGAWLAAPAGAFASGGPAPPVQGGPGVTAAGGPFRYIALGAGRRTLLERVRRAGGTFAGSRLFAGSFGEPMVAYDGSFTGLSADGRTLVLAEMSRLYPPPRTRLLVIDASRLRATARITLPGFFAVDAISPTGRWLYLIHYLRPTTDPTAYEVRAYNLASRRLAAQPVVDPREPGEKMQGIAVTRTMSSDGRWAYTLYQRNDGKAFIHALDTAARAAYCVDLPLPSADVSSARLVLGPGPTLLVDSGGAALAAMNTRTFAVRVPAPAPRPRPARKAAVGSGSAGALIAAIATVAILLLLAFVLLARRHRHSAIPRSPVTDAR